MSARLLIVYDNMAVRSILADYFQMHDCQVDLAENGQDAIELVSHHGNIYHCILTDIHIPVMGGLSLAHAVHRVYPEMPIIAITATPYQAMPNLSRFASMITNPFELSALLNPVQNICFG